MFKFSKQTLIVSFLAINLCFSSLIVAHAASPSAAENEPEPTLQERIDQINDFLNTIDQSVTSFLSNFSSILNFLPIDQGLISDVNSISKLFARLYNYPSEVSGWWKILTNTAKQEFNDCASLDAFTLGRGVTPPFVPNPEWCIFTAQTQRTTDENGNAVPNPYDYDSASQSNEGVFSPSRKKTETILSNSTDIGTIAENSMGVAGIPDLARMRNLAYQMIDNGKFVDNFVTPKVIQKFYAGQLIDRSFATWRANFKLSDYGQVSDQAQLQEVQRLSADSIGAVQTALQSNVTQDVMKNMAKSQFGNTLLLGSLVSSMTRQTNDNATTHILLSDISRALDAETRERFTERSAAINHFVYRASQISLF